MRRCVRNNLTRKPHHVRHFEFSVTEMSNLKLRSILVLEVDLDAWRVTAVLHAI